MQLHDAPHLCPDRLVAALLALLLVSSAVSSPAHALCDVIPQPNTVFRGETGSLNRVYASPGDPVRISIDPAGCEAGSPAFGADPDVVLAFTPPQGIPNVVVLGGNGGAECAVLAAEIATCQTALPPGATVACLEQGATVNGNVLTFAFPDTQDVVGAPADGLPLSGPVTVAVTTGGIGSACGLASSSCKGVGSQPDLAVCIDSLYASDGTCGTEAAQRHGEFPGLTALPQRNDFEAICSSADPSIPCNATGADLHFTTDAAGNVVIPVDWRGVLVPGTLPIPRLVRGASQIPAFSGPPPEPTQTPGAPLQVPGRAFLQSFSAKGLRVDPLFNPLFSDDQALATELFGSVDADFGVTRLLRRSPAFRECDGGTRAGLACVADGECPGALCGAATCRGGSNNGLPCASDLGCPSGECGSALFDFSDRYSDSDTGPVVLSSADYDAEALNPAAIDGLESTDDLFMFVRSEPIEAKDLNLDGDELDETIVTIRNARTGESFDLGIGGAIGPASTRVRQFPFAFPAVAVEGDVVALLVSEPDEQVDENGDGDDWDAALRIFRLEGGGPVDLLGGGGGPAADGLPLVDRQSLKVSDGLVFFRESEPDGADRVTVPLPNPNFLGGVPTPDGRFVVGYDEQDGFLPGDANGCDDVVVYDRDTDQDGIYDEAEATSWTIVSVDSSGQQVTHPNCAAPGDPWINAEGIWDPLLSISDDGRHVVFTSLHTDLVDDDDDVARDVFVHDRDTDGDGIFDEPGAIATLCVNKATGPGSSCLGGGGGTISGDGRWVVFYSVASLQASDTNGLRDFYVRDRDTDEDGVFDEPFDVATYRLTDALGVEPTSTFPEGWGGVGVVPTMTGDGRYVAFSSYANNLDGPVEGGLFVLDRDADEDGTYDEFGEVTIRRVSITTTGSVESVRASNPRLSGDGRRVLFFAEGLAPGSGALLHDRDVDGNGVFDEPGGIETRRLPHSQATQATLGAGLGTLVAALSRDGRIAMQVAVDGVLSSHSSDRIDVETGVVAQLQDGSRTVPNFFAMEGFPSAAMVPGGETLAYWNGDTMSGDFRVDGVDPASPVNDISGDGDQDDRVLAVADATLPPPVVVTALAPATQVAVADGNAVFLRPEAAEGSGVDLNGDLDTNDRVVHLYRNRATLPPGENLGRAATAVATSAQYLAALVSEGGEGLVLNSDGDQADRVVHVNALATATSGTWVNLGLAGDTLQVVGSRVAFRVPEADQGASLNGDGDQDDRVLRIYDAGAATLLAFQDELGNPVAGYAIDDFVLGNEVAAFRVDELGQGLDLNGDADLEDAVLHVIVLSTGTVYNSMQAAIPCPVEACDPRTPYRIVGDKVTFLTLEADQGGFDLDQNGDGGTGLVVQHFNPGALAAGLPLASAGAVLAGTLGGVCTASAEACATDADCGGSTCYLPPGGCLLDTLVACNPDTEDSFGGTDDCGALEFCAPLLGMPGQGTCQSFQGPCIDDGQCSGGAVCTDDGGNAEQVFSSIDASTDGRQTFVHLGVCSDGDGACSMDADCNEGATCSVDLSVIATAADPDADGLADPIDNCPDLANGDQLDADQDGIGDACDRQTCGDGVQSYAETCDDGNTTPGDGCDDSCQIEGGFMPACSNGLDDDGDGLVDDGADPGCTGAGDLSEREPGLPCDDGLDDDGDFGVDFPGDPGCESPTSLAEDPECDDRIDNDGDGGTDWDGSPADAECAGAPYADSELLPEPSSGLILLAGIGLLSLLRRSRPGAGASRAAR